MTESRPSSSLPTSEHNRATTQYPSTPGFVSNHWWGGRGLVRIDQCATVRRLQCSPGCVPQQGSRGRSPCGKLAFALSSIGSGSSGYRRPGSIRRDGTRCADSLLLGAGCALFGLGKRSFQDGSFVRRATFTQDLAQLLYCGQRLRMVVAKRMAIAGQGFTQQGFGSGEITLR